MRPRHPLLTPLLTSAATLLLAVGCSSGDDGAAPAATPSATASPTPSATPSPAAAPTPAATASPTPSTLAPADPLSPRPGLESPAPVGQPACRSEDLTVTDADMLVSPQYVQEVYAVRTTGRPCQLAGYPRVTLLGPDGRPLAVTVQHGGFGLPPEQPATVTLSRTTSLSFTLATARDGACTDTTALLTTLPGTAAAIRAATELRVCGGRVGVTPVHRQGEQE
jgi:hypothetical protein